MTGKMPRFLIASIASILLAACGAETLDAIPNETEETIEAIESESEVTQSTDSVEVEEEETEVTSGETDESETTEVAEKEAEIAANELQTNNKEQALNQLLLETHLEKDGYSFYFAETDSLDFIEIEVREIQEDSEHSSLEGAYRYIIETEEILMRDYLTGDFIPYEEIE